MQRTVVAPSDEHEYENIVFVILLYTFFCIQKSIFTTLGSASSICFCRRATCREARDFCVRGNIHRMCSLKFICAVNKIKIFAAKVTRVDRSMIIPYISSTLSLVADFHSHVSVPVSVAVAKYVRITFIR